jgi:hypothetical protein
LIVEVFFYLHSQNSPRPCYTGEGMDDYTPMSISARFISNPAQHGDWPLFDYDASRQANLAVHDALPAGVPIDFCK